MPIQNRTQITIDQINDGMHLLNEKLNHRLAEKGMGTFASKHEVLGVLEEEMDELKEAVRQHNTYDRDCVKDPVYEELMDIAVGALFGAICRSNKTMDW